MTLAVSNSSHTPASLAMAGIEYSLLNRALTIALLLSYHVRKNDQASEYDALDSSKSRISSARNPANDCLK